MVLPCDSVGYPRLEHNLGSMLGSIWHFGNVGESLYDLSTDIWNILVFVCSGLAKVGIW